MKIHHKKAMLHYGVHNNLEILKNNKREILNIYTSHNVREKYKKILNKFQSRKILHVVESRSIERKLDAKQNHQGLVIETQKLQQPSLENIMRNDDEKSMIIILDQVQDINNIGAIFRSALAFNASAIIAQDRNCPDETPGLINVARGAFEHIPFIRVVNIAQTIKELQDNDYLCYGLDGHSTTDIRSLKFPKKVALVLGSEESGIRTLVQKKCDQMIKINMSNAMESLNVSHASTIAMHEAFSQLFIKQL